MWFVITSLSWNFTASPTRKDQPLEKVLSEDGSAESTPAHASASVKLPAGFFPKNFTPRL